MSQAFRKVVWVAVLVAAWSVTSPQMSLLRANVEESPIWRLDELVVRDQKPADVRMSAQGTLVTNAAQLSARVVAPADAFLCRLTPAGNPDLVQLTIGRVKNLRCNALYSPSRDEAVQFEAEQVSISWQGDHYRLTGRGPLRMSLTRDYMKKTRGVTYYKPLDKSVFSRAPTGWCSWYIYYFDVSEQDMVRHTDWLAAHLQPFGLQFVQLDDGWQGRGRGLGDNRDWYVTATHKFPHGMKWLADYIRGRGLSPGIWVVPCATSDEKLFREKPELFVRRPDGSSVFEDRDPTTGKLKFNWTGRYVIDPTSPASRKWTEDLFRMVCLEWGYDFVKLDGQGGATEACRRFHDRLADPSLPPDDAYRLQLEAMATTVGPKRFLLNVGQEYASCGYHQGIRIGDDIGGPDWSRMPRMLSATLAHLYKNSICFWTDPDIVCVRPPLTLDQARACATLVGITGQLVMLGDDMLTLSADRVEVLKRILPAADICPVDLYPLTGNRRIFDLRVAKAGVGQWDVVAVFNWDNKPASVHLEPRELGLLNGDYLYYDVWEKKLLGHGTSGWTVSLPATSCKLLTVRPRLAHPQLLGTSRHITQGADDLIGARWDPDSSCYIGQSKVVGKDPYEICFSLPHGWTCEEPGVRVDGGLAILTLQSKEDASLRWKIGFQKSGPATVQAIPFETFNGYFVSNRFEPNAPNSFAVVADQKHFDNVFGVAMVMGDQSHRLPDNLFASRIVLATVKRGDAVWSFRVEDVTLDSDVVKLRYTTTAKKSNTTSFACPLIVSIPHGPYRAVEFIENGKLVTKLDVAAPKEPRT